MFVIKKGFLFIAESYKIEEKDNFHPAPMNSKRR